MLRTDRGGRAYGARRWRRAAWAAAGGVILLVAVAAAVRFALPLVAKGILVSRLEAATGGAASLAELEIHLLSGRVLLRDLAVLDRHGGARLLALRSLETTIPLRSLLRGRLTLPDASIRRPEITVERDGAGVIRVAGIQAYPPPTPSTRLPIDVILRRAEVSDGTIHLTDRSTDPATRVTLAGVDAVLESLSTRAADAETPWRIRLAARVGPGRLKAAGAIAPLAAAPRADLTVNLRGGDPGALAAYLPRRPERLVGSLSASGHYRLNADGVAGHSIQGRLEALGIEVVLAPGGRIVRADRATVSGRGQIQMVAPPSWRAEIEAEVSGVEARGPWGGVGRAAARRIAVSARADSAKGGLDGRLNLIGLTAEAPSGPIRSGRAETIALAGVLGLGGDRRIPARGRLEAKGLAVAGGQGEVEADQVGLAGEIDLRPGEAPSGSGKGRLELAGLKVALPGTQASGLVADALTVEGTFAGEIPSGRLRAAGRGQMEMRRVAARLPGPWPEAEGATLSLSGEFTVDERGRRVRGRGALADLSARLAGPLGPGATVRSVTVEGEIGGPPGAERGSGKVEVAGLVVEGGQPSAPSFRADRVTAMGEIDVAERAARLSRVDVMAPHAAAARGPDGSIDLLQLLPVPLAPRATVPVAAPAARPSGKEARWEIGQLEIQGGTAQFADRSRQTPVEVEIKDLNISAWDLSSDAAKPIRVGLGADVGRFGIISGTATVTRDPLSMALEGRVAGVRFPELAPLLPRDLPLRVTGGTATVEAEGEISRRPDGRWRGQARGAVTLEGPRLEGPGPADRYSAEKVLVKVAGATLDPLAVHLSEVWIGGPALEFTLARESQGARGAGLSAAGAAAAKFLPFLLDIDEMNFVGGAFRILDAAQDPPFPVEIREANIALAGLSGSRRVPATFGLSLRLGPEARLAGEGRASLQPLNVETSLEVERFDLTLLRPYLPGLLGRIVQELGLNGKGRVALRQGEDGALAAEGEGVVEASPVRLVLGPEGRPFLTAEAIRAEVASAGTAPPRAHLRRLDIRAPWVRLERDGDGRIPLLELFEGFGAAAAAGPGGTATEVTIDELALANGVARITDRAVTPPFQERLEGFTLRVARLSTTAPEPAEVEVRGTFSDRSTFALRGRVLARDPARSAEIEGELSGLNLTALNPYAIRFTSYRLEHGKLKAEARYTVTDGRLKGTHLIEVDQLTLGDQVEEPDRFQELVGVPIGLAVSLLQERDGRIFLHVPVEGDLWRPQFDLGEAINKAIGNAVVGVITAPFQLIGKIFEAAGKVEALEVDPVPFAPGSWTLDARTTEQLRKVGEYLRFTPGAKLQLLGRADPASDRGPLRGTRAEAFLQRMERERGARARRQALDSLYRRAAEARAQAAAPGSGQKVAVNATGREPTEAEKLQVIRDHLPITDDNLMELALNRARAVYDWLVGAEKVEARRLFQGDGLLVTPAPGAPADDGRQVRFKLLASP